MSVGAKWVAQAIGVMAVAVVSLGLSAAPASATQCIWNKGGYVLRVDWFKPGAVAMGLGNDGVTEFGFEGQPDQTDMIWSGNGQCINRGNVEYEAVVSICGGSFKTRVIKYSSDWPEDQKINCGILGLFSPGTTHWMDFWGPVWGPESGNGGRI